ncbi:hypothetical protein HWD87_04470 [Enterococcus gallinarum]|nr:hypothetical protein [Enterococcus gallinarum]
MASSSVDLGVWKILPIFAIVTITSTSKKIPRLWLKLSVYKTGATVYFVASVLYSLPNSLVTSQVE